LTLSLNPKTPRIVKRIEAGFEKLGVPFHKTRPAGLFYRKISANPADVMTSDVESRFEVLFTAIGQRLKKSIAKAAEPFH